MGKVDWISSESPTAPPEYQETTDTVGGAQGGTEGAEDDEG